MQVKFDYKRKKAGSVLLLMNASRNTNLQVTWQHCQALCWDELTHCRISTELPLMAILLWSSRTLVITQGKFTIILIKLVFCLWGFLVLFFVCFLFVLGFVFWWFFFISALGLANKTLPCRNQWMVDSPAWDVLFLFTVRTSYSLNYIFWKINCAWR